MATKKSSPQKKAAAKKATVSKKATVKKAAAPVKKASKPIPDIKGEVWKKIRDTDRPYFVSNMGRIKSFYYDTKNGTLLKGKHVNGYLAMDIVSKGVRGSFYVHQIVAKHFIPKKSPKQTVVIHKDWKKMNNKVSNLEWSTITDAYARTAIQNQKLNRQTNRVTLNAKLRRDQVIEIKKMLKGGALQKAVATKFKISEMQISRIAHGVSWGYVKV
jgi:hypothetical protein